MFKKLLYSFYNPLDALLKTAGTKRQSRFLLFWNRGLGDIPLGLYAIIYRIRHFIPEAEITFLTRPNLKDGFTLLGGVNILVAPSLKRGDKVEVSALLKELKVKQEDFDVIIENPNPTQWVAWQLGKLTPLLHWQEKWEGLHEKWHLSKNEVYVGAHVQTETNYASWRNWPVSAWNALFKSLTSKGIKVLLFGFEQDTLFEREGVIDLRGKTPLFDLLSLIKNHCRALVVPDSGISSMVYFLNASFPLTHVSLWADPYMGILKQNVPSPNPQLLHIPLIGKNKNCATITPNEVEQALASLAWSPL